MNEPLTIAELIEESHRTAVEKGWWDGPERSVGDQFMNFTAEVSEAWEEYRKFGMDATWMIYHFDASRTSDGKGVIETPVAGVGCGKKPEGIAVELADLLIRVADTCGKYGIPLEEALRVKLAYNKTRSFRHGNKKA